MLELPMESSPVNELDQSPTKSSTSNQIEIGNNGDFDAEIEKLASGGPVEGNGEEIENEKPMETLTEVPELSLGSASPGVSPTSSKGYGLKKWRRIRRDFIKDGSSGLDSNRNLKRGLSNAKGPAKARDLSSEIKQMNKGSVASADSLIRSPTLPSGFVNIGLSLDSRLALGSAFPFGADSDNSEDRSSKSSTAASAPKLRNVKPTIMGSARDKSKPKKYPGGESSGNAAQRVQLGKGGGAETSKKFRGDQIKVEKDNSYSSVESDMRSSNILFPENGSFSGIIKGTRTERSSNYEGESSYEAQASNQQSSDETRMDSCKDNEGEADDVSQIDEAAEVSWEEKEEEGINLQPSTSHDPFDESVISLQAVQEALQKEIQNFGELGKVHILLADDSAYNSEIYDLNSSSQLHFEGMEKTDPLPQEGGLIELKQKIYLLEKKLEDALSKLKVKESMVVELEDALRKSELPKGESRSSVEEKCWEMEIELDDLFKQKIEAELEYFAITRTTQELKVAIKDQIKLFEGGKSLIEEQKQILHKVKDAESRLVVVKKQGEELESSLRAEEVLVMGSRVCGLSLCLFVQLILLLLAFFFLQLPNSTDVVPT